MRHLLDSEILWLLEIGDQGIKLWFITVRSMGVEPFITIIDNKNYQTSTKSRKKFSQSYVAESSMRLSLLTDHNKRFTF